VFGLVLIVLRPIMKACFWIGSSSFGSRFEESSLLTGTKQQQPHGRSE